MKGFRQRQDGLLGHPVEQVVRFGVEEDRPPDGVGPEVVVSHPAQGGFDPAQDDRAGVLEMTANEIRIGNDCPVGTAVVLTAGSVVVRAAFFLEGGVIGHHRVDAAAGHPPEQARLAQAGDVCRGGDIGLGDDPHPVAGALKHPSDHGRADEGAVDIAVTADQDHIERVPAAFGHLRGGGG